ncbi:hypothetical protein GCM10009755_19450 [Brevibacterium samyangense]|uniref:Uncharacterized protein n=1 Tax=Brevibacterium samyangense TaxID=366888 RepID=A0ABN2TGU2_9MICO
MFFGEDLQSRPGAFAPRTRSGQDVACGFFGLLCFEARQRSAFRRPERFASDLARRLVLRVRPRLQIAQFRIREIAYTLRLARTCPGRLLTRRRFGRLVTR